MTGFLEKVEAHARAEIKKEDFNRLVQEKKVQLRLHVPFWHRVFPFKLVRR